MVVAHVVQTLGWGGLERVVLDLTRALDRARFQPLVVALSDHVPMADLFEAAGVPVHSVPQRGLDWRLPGRLAALLRREQVAIVHAHNFGRFFYAGPAARLARVPVALYTEHSNTRPDERALWLTQRRLSRLAPRIAAVSDAVRDYLIARQGLPAERIVTLSNGIDVGQYRLAESERLAARRELGLPERGLVVGTVARLVPVKNQALLLRALALCAGQPPHLVLAGDGPLRAELEALARTLGVGEWVRFAGLCRDVPRVLAALDVFALTSHSEGLPIAVIEAMAAGLPVTATAVGGLPELVAHESTGLLVGPDDAEALAQAWQRLHEPELRRRLGQAGQRVAVVRYSLDAMVAGYSALYDECLAAART
jgi:sugar transferase (PEP-CTERM/EpsH1 system associated)